MIVLSDVSRGYREGRSEISWVLRNIDLRVSRGDRIGILGEPEAGKTTLINLLAGSDDPTKGRIIRNGSVSWPIGSQFCIMPALTGRQNIRFICDLYGRNYADALDFVTHFSGLERQLDLSIRRYKGEMKARLAASMLFAMDFDCMLGDDSLFGGDPAFKARCHELLRERLEGGAAFVTATSNPIHVRQFCRKAGILADGRIEMFEDVEEAVSRFIGLGRANAA